jgi:UDP-N-acetylglucosamine transferase subunit ALG13
MVNKEALGFTYNANNKNQLINTIRILEFDQTTKIKQLTNEKILYRYCIAHSNTGVWTAGSSIYTVHV